MKILRPQKLPWTNVAVKCDNSAGMCPRQREHLRKPGRPIMHIVNREAYKHLQGMFSLGVASD